MFGKMLKPRDSCGLLPLATCSPKNFDLVRSYGAEQVFDYHSPTCADDIRAHTKNSLRYVLDCITTPATLQLCYSVIGRLGGKYTALELPPQIPGLRKTVKSDWVMGVTVFGQEIRLSEGYYQPPNLEHHAFGLNWVKIVQDLIDKEELRSHPVKVMTGRFEGILKGLDLLSQQKVSGQKLVYFISDPQTAIKEL